MKKIMAVHVRFDTVSTNKDGEQTLQIIQLQSPLPEYSDLKALLDDMVKIVNDTTGSSLGLKHDTKKITKELGF